MHGKQCVRTPQQRLVRRHADNSDAQAFFNLLIGAELLDKVESGLPTHRERLFPPTETLSMFLVAGTECGSLLPEGRKRRGGETFGGGFVAL